MINMADREDLETPFDRQRAVSLLEEATQFLREYSGGSAVSTPSRSGENSEIQPAGSRRNEPHSSQRLQANHTRFPHTTTTASSAFTHQNRQGNEDNILSGSFARNSAANGRVLDNFLVFFCPMVAKRRQLAHQVYNCQPPVNKGNVTHSSLKEKLGLTNFSAWQIKIRW